MGTGRFASLGLATLVAMGAAGAACRRDAPRPLDPPALPRLALTPAQAAAVSRIELERPEDGEPTRRSKIVLERRGPDWRLTAPMRARASADKVAALLANLQDLHVVQRLDPGITFYDRFDLTDARALHVVARDAAGQTVVDFLAGKSSEQGQLIRLPGAPGLFALMNDGPHGYQGFLYTRDLRGWRDPGLLSFQEADVERVEIANRHGFFQFWRREAAGSPPASGAWTAAFAPRRADGKLASPGPVGARFDPGRVEQMLHAYHALAADDFGTPAELASAGVDDAERTGGVVRIHLVHRPQPLVLRVGAPSPGGSRFAIPGSRWAVPGEVTAERADDESPSALSPWTARWAIADVRSFERAH